VVAVTANCVAVLVELMDDSYTKYSLINMSGINSIPGHTNGTSRPYKLLKS
jgi:hypothetical protein